MLSLLLVPIYAVNAETEGSDTKVESSKETIKAEKSNSVTFNKDIMVVTILIVIVIALFFIEPIRLDIIALSIPVILFLLKPWTDISTSEALSGFANTATITVLAMFILSEGIQRSGVMQIIGDKIAQITGSEEKKQIGIISGFSGVIAGILNNTPVVAIFIPMVRDLARKTKNSPSKLLMPLSYASMMGGMVTLIGTSTNLLASNLSARLLGHPFSMFEFTKLGLVVLVIGGLYLVTIGYKLVPERIKPNEKLVEEYEMASYLTEVVIIDDSPLVGENVDEFLDRTELDMNLLQIICSGDEDKCEEPSDVEELQAGDHLIIRADEVTLFHLVEREGLELVPEVQVTKQSLETPAEGKKLIEVVIPHGSTVEGQTLAEVNFLEQYNSLMMAIRRGGQLTHQQMEEISIQAGDVLLVLAPEDSITRFSQSNDFIVADDMKPDNYRQSKMPIALGILAVVIGLAAFELVPIVISAIGGIVAMIVTGCIKPKEVYPAVNWEVIFLLAGLIPLGIAMEQTGTAKFVANQLLKLSKFVSPVIMLAIFYFITSILTNIISNNASAILMIPVAVDAATKMGVNPFAFVMAVTFAASTAFLTPVGYQTNLMVYGPGGYKFRDYLIAGAPLQILLGIVTTIGITFFWGL